MITPHILHWLYAHIAKPIFFRIDPERVHDCVTWFGRMLGNTAPTRWATKKLFAYTHTALEQTVLGIHFPNPIGLSAGFDKNGELTDILPSVGFGFVEIGSVTGEPCAGNPKPRLWRLPKSRGLVVWYGLKNDGCAIVAGRLRTKKEIIPLGTSVARTNIPETTSTEAGIADYVKAFSAFADVGSYTTVNISCPNTCGGEPFTSPELLEQLLTALDAVTTKKPTFIKLPADINPAALDALVAVCDRHRVQGFIVTNLTKRRDNPALDAQEATRYSQGGISGKPASAQSNELISHLYKHVGTRYVIIGSGGVFTAQDAYEKIKRGATLVQLITGMIFEGPQLIGAINAGLVPLLRADGFSSLSEAVGSAHRHL